MAHNTDERTPLVSHASSSTVTAIDHERINAPPMSRPLWARIMNPRLTSRPLRLFEICDFGIVPGFLRRRCQILLTTAWSQRVPLLQQVTPAELAAKLILRTLEEIGDLDEGKISVIDFCSGAGGPIPTIERIVNEQRSAQGKKPVPFLMSDLYPNLDAWLEVCAQSKGSLSFIPQEVDATDPPVSATSSTSRYSRTAQGYRSDTRVFRLYCLAFHHFDDELARKVLESTMQTADGFAIIELQDRYLSSFALILGNIPFMYVMALYRHWRNVWMLFFVYVLPVVPFINTFDGLVSCLRTRSFKEVMGLIGAKITGSNAKEKSAAKDDWVFRSAYEMHSWPVGYMNYIVGFKKKHGTSPDSVT